MINCLNCLLQMHNCPICGAISRGTENSPPLLHEAVALPALIGGSWISPTCESHPGGVWLRRQLRVYAGDKLWSGRWDYFGDPRCSGYLYGITAAGSYVQRARRQRRRDTGMAHQESDPLAARPRRSLDEVDYYRHLLQNAQPSMAESFAAMLRGNQRREETTKKPLPTPAPTGTSELDLHVAESLLIAGDSLLAQRCGTALGGDGRTPKSQKLNSWPSSCVPHSIDAPSTLGLRARISVDWYGQYTLQLGSRDRHLWDAPLVHCGAVGLRNPLLKSHLRKSVGLRFGILFNGASAKSNGIAFSLFGQLVVLCFGYLALR